MKYHVEEGLLGGTLPYLSIGQGEPLLFVRTVTPEIGNPTGASRWAEMRALEAYAGSYKVYAVSRDPKASNAKDMSLFASQYADAIQREFSGPVYMLGASTGGSLALQIAADHPEQVKGLAVTATAYRLSPEGKALQNRYAAFLQKHDLRNAEKTLSPLITKTKIGALVMGALLWLTAPLAGKPEYEQMVAYLNAEDTFNIQDRLVNIVTPTLIVAGDKDKVYDIADVIEMTKAMPHAVSKIYPNAGHRQVIADSSSAKVILDFFATLTKAS